MDLVIVMFNQSQSMTLANCGFGCSKWCVYRRVVNLIYLAFGTLTFSYHNFTLLFYTIINNYYRVNLNPIINIQIKKISILVLRNLKGNNLVNLLTFDQFFLLTWLESCKIECLCIIFS